MARRSIEDVEAELAQAHARVAALLEERKKLRREETPVYQWYAVPAECRTPDCEWKPVVGPIQICVQFNSEASRAATDADRLKCAIELGLGSGLRIAAPPVAGHSTDGGVWRDAKFKATVDRQPPRCGPPSP